MSLVIYDNIGERISKAEEVDSKFTTRDRLAKHVHPLDVGSIECSEAERERAIAITGLPDLGGRMRFYGALAQHIIGNWNVAARS